MTRLTTIFFTLQVISVLLGAHLLHIGFATPVPLAIENNQHLRLIIDSDMHAKQISLAFNSANRYLQNLKRVLGHDPNVPRGAMAAILHASFGSLAGSQIRELQRNVDELLTTSHIRVGNDAYTPRHPAQEPYVAAHRHKWNDIVFSLAFFDLPPFCQALLVIHEAIHHKFGYSDWFIRSTNPHNQQVEWRPSKAGPNYEPSGTVLYGGYEHSDMDYLIMEAGGTVSLLNPDSYASAAYRATLILELGLDPQISFDADYLKKPFFSTACPYQKPGDHKAPHPVTVGHPAHTAAAGFYLA